MLQPEDGPEFWREKRAEVEAPLGDDLVRPRKMEIVPVDDL